MEETQQRNVFLDMETGDPDDIMTLLLLLTHSKVILRGVSIFPGDKFQVGFIKALLKKYTKHDIPIGSYNSNSDKNSLGKNNINLFGQDLEWKPCNPDAEGYELMIGFFKKYPGGTIITGCPLGNIYKYLQNCPDATMDDIFLQGGFAGALCVPEENQLPKFKGLTTCPTFNFNGHPQGAFAVLEAPNIKQRHLVSKDVCHGVAWDRRLHILIKHYKRKTNPCWDMLISSMDSYLRKKPEGNCNLLAFITHKMFYEIDIIFMKNETA